MALSGPMARAVLRFANARPAARPAVTPQKSNKAKMAQVMAPGSHHGLVLEEVTRME